MSRKKKYKTEKEAIAARKMQQKEYYEKNKHLWRERYCHYTPRPKQDTSALEKRIAALETEFKELLLDFDEVLKDNKKLADLIKWGKT